MALKKENGKRAWGKMEKAEATLLLFPHFHFFQHHMIAISFFYVTYIFLYLSPFTKVSTGIVVYALILVALFFYNLGGGAKHRRKI
jgi:hypothetical protein